MNSFPFYFGRQLLLIIVRVVAWEQVKGLRARAWPVVQGTVEHGEVAEHRTRYGKYYLAHLSYSYTVAGEYYSGFHEKFSADGCAAKLKGQIVFVRHKPTLPERSALLKQDQMGTWPA